VESLEVKPSIIHARITPPLILSTGKKPRNFLKAAWKLLTASIVRKVDLLLSLQGTAVQSQNRVAKAAYFTFLRELVLCINVILLTLYEWEGSAERSILLTREIAAIDARRVESIVHSSQKSRLIHSFLHFIETSQIKLVSLYITTLTGWNTALITDPNTRNR